MKQLPKLRPSVWDALVAFVVAVLAVGGAFALLGQKVPARDLTVVVSIEGKEVERCALAEFPAGSGVYSNRGYTLQVGVSYPISPDVPCVQVIASDCPTQDCVRIGEISRAGQSIVCLPARVIIQLEGETPTADGPDIVIG